MKTREELIDAGRIWQVSPDNDGDNVLHECGSRSACMKWLRENKMMRQYKTGTIRIGRVIWEKEKPITI